MVMPQAEFTGVQKFLSGVSYPATREQLVQHAQGNGAGQEALDALRDIPDLEYAEPSEVSLAVAFS